MYPPSNQPIIPTPPATTLSYDQSSQLMVDMTFRGRVKVACLNYATYIGNEDSSVAAHTTRIKWASNCFMNPDMVAQQTQPPVVMDPSVQQQGSAIDDAALQAAVEDTINKMM